MIGRVVSHYRILQPLGGGGMGVVYKAEDTRLARPVALKFLAPELTRDEDAKKRFLQEARAASALDHPNVCTVYEVGETEEGQMYLAMAFYEGETLRTRIEQGPLPLEEALRIAIGIGCGLEHAHQAGVVHRDVKPANVILTPQGEPKIVDFGLARLGDTTRLTREGTTLGTPAYMSPEHARGEDADGRSDVWSLGVVLHEMLAGVPPFKGGSASAVIYSILHEKPPRLAQTEGVEASPAVQAVLDRALTKDPAERYPSASGLVTDLEALRDGDGRTLTELLTTTGRRRRARRGGAAVLLLLAALSASFFFLRARRSAGPRPGTSSRVVAILPFTVRGGEELGYLGEGLVDLLSTKLDGAGDLRSVDPHALLGAVALQGKGRLDPERALPIAERFGAALFVIGEILEAGGRLHISASLYARDGREPISRASVEGEAAKLFDLVDGLAAELLAKEVSGPGTRITRIAAVTTGSLPALKTYLRGEAELRQGQSSAALETFQRAVEQDPSFALAWYRLSVAAEWATRNDLVETSAAEAVRLADRLSPLDRRLLEARLAHRRGELGEAERLYRAILDTHADDVESWLQLGEVLHHRGHLGHSMVSARAAWERALSFEPDNVLALWHLARVAAKQDRRQELISLVDRILRLNPEGERVVEVAALKAFSLHDAEAEKAVLRELRSVSDHVVVLTAWNVAVTTDQVAGCRAVLDLLAPPTRSADAVGLGWVALAHLELTEGRWRAAQRRLEAGESVAPVRSLEHRALLSLSPFLSPGPAELERIRQDLVAWDASQVPPTASRSNYFSANDGVHPHIRLYLIGALGARLGDPAAATHAHRLERLASPPRAPALASNLAAGVRAQVQLAEGRTARALELLEQVRFDRVTYQDASDSPFFSQALERYARAESLRALGRAEEALVWYSSFAEVSLYDLTFLAPSHFRRAEIEEQRGRGAEAALHYRRFLALWKEPDPELQGWVATASERLARLEAAATTEVR